MSIVAAFADDYQWILYTCKLNGTCSVMQIFKQRRLLLQQWLQSQMIYGWLLCTQRNIPYTIIPQIKYCGVYNVFIPCLTSYYISAVHFPSSTNLICTIHLLSFIIQYVYSDYIVFWATEKKNLKPIQCICIDGSRSIT